MSAYEVITTGVRPDFFTRPRNHPLVNHKLLQLYIVVLSIAWMFALLLLGQIRPKMMMYLGLFSVLAVSAQEISMWYMVLMLHGVSTISLLGLLLRSLLSVSVLCYPSTFLVPMAWRSSLLSTLFVAM